MARLIQKLSPAKVQKGRKPGLYGDGAGLYLHVGPAGGKSWILRHMIEGKAREMGLGPVHAVGLAEARDRAQERRRLILDGIDPLELKENKRQAARLMAATAITFKACAGKIHQEQPSWLAK